MGKVVGVEAAAKAVRLEYGAQILFDYPISSAGPTGVELAGATIDLTRITLMGDFRNIYQGGARMALIEAGARVLANFTPEMSAYAERALKASGSCSTVR